MDQKTAPILLLGTIWLKAYLLQKTGFLKFIRESGLLITKDIFGTGMSLRPTCLNEQDVAVTINCTK